MDDQAIRILLVEDNPGDVRLTQEIFKDAGLDNELIVACDGEEALVCLGYDLDNMHGPLKPIHPLDLVVIDLNLPKLDGRELLEILRTHPILSKTPIIILTKSLDDRQLTISHMLHAKAYVEKPLDVASLVTALQVYPQFGYTITRRTARTEKGIRPAKAERASSERQQSRLSLG